MVPNRLRNIPESIALTLPILRSWTRETRASIEHCATALRKKTPRGDIYNRDSEQPKKGGKYTGLPNKFASE